MPKITPIATIMTKCPVTAGIDESLESVRKTLVAEDIHHLPILEGNELVGIISSRDLVRAYRKFGRSSLEVDPGGRPLASIRDTMATNLVTMRSDESIDRAIDILADGAIHSVLVIDEEERLVGIATNIDILDYLFD